MASVALGVGLGVSGLMKSEVAGPAPFLISDSDYIRISWYRWREKECVPTARILPAIILLIIL